MAADSSKCSIETFDPATFSHSCCRNCPPRKGKPYEVHPRGKSVDRNLENTTHVPVLVYEGDWGDVTRILTVRYGKTFAVLNMANATVPGGGVMRGSTAMEENLWRRSNCSSAAESSPLTVTIEGTKKLRYKEALDLIPIFDHDPRFCFLGPDLCGHKKDRYLIRSSYAPLQQDEIFPFFELVSAADNTNRFDDWEAFDSQHKEAYVESMQKKIHHQLHQLVGHGVRHVVLSAFGCGAFLNKKWPVKYQCKTVELVANLYKRKIQEYGAHFEVICFAVHDGAGYGRTGGDSNSKIFRRVFSSSGRVSMEQAMPGPKQAFVPGPLAKILSPHLRVDQIRSSMEWGWGSADGGGTTTTGAATVDTETIATEQHKIPTSDTDSHESPSLIPTKPTVATGDQAMSWSQGDQAMSCASMDADAAPDSEKEDEDVNDNASIASTASTLHECSEQTTMAPEEGVWVRVWRKNSECPETGIPEASRHDLWVVYVEGWTMHGTVRAKAEGLWHAFSTKDTRPALVSVLKGSNGNTLAALFRERTHAREFYNALLASVTAMADTVQPHGVELRGGGWFFGPGFQHYHCDTLFATGKTSSFPATCADTLAILVRPDSEAPLELAGTPGLLSAIKLLYRWKQSSMYRLKEDYAKEARASAEFVVLVFESEASKVKASQFLSSCSVDEEYTCFPHVSADRYFTSTEEPDVGVNDKLICEASAYANTPWVANALRLTLQHAEDDLMRVYQARSPSHNLTHTRRTDTQETAAEYANLRGHSCHLCTQCSGGHQARCNGLVRITPGIYASVKHDGQWRYGEVTRRNGKCWVIAVPEDSGKLKLLSRTSNRMRDALPPGSHVSTISQDSPLDVLRNSTWLNLPPLSELWHTWPSISEEWTEDPGQHQISIGAETLVVNTVSSLLNAVSRQLDPGDGQVPVQTVIKALKGIALDDEFAGAVTDEIEDRNLMPTDVVLFVKPEHILRGDPLFSDFFAAIAQGAVEYILDNSMRAQYEKGGGKAPAVLSKRHVLSFLQGDLFSDSMMAIVTEETKGTVSLRASKASEAAVRVAQQACAVTTQLLNRIRTVAWWVDSHITDLSVVRPKSTTHAPTQLVPPEDLRIPTAAETKMITSAIRNLQVGEIAGFARVNSFLRSWAVVREDLERLSGGWLNDHIVNAWLSLCNEHSHHRKILFHNSYFMEVLNGGGYDFERVKKWALKSGVRDIFRCELVIVPINIGRFHWILGVIHMHDKRIQIYDPAGEDHQEFGFILKRYISDLDKLRGSDHDNAVEIRGHVPYKKSEWVVSGKWPYMSSQTDGDTCGVHVCMAVLAILCDKEGEMQSFSGAAIRKHRRTILLCLVHGRLTQSTEQRHRSRRARRKAVDEASVGGAGAEKGQLTTHPVAAEIRMRAAISRAAAIARTTMASANRSYDEERLAVCLAIAETVVEWSPIVKHSVAEAVRVTAVSAISEGKSSIGGVAISAGIVGGLVHGLGKLSNLATETLDRDQLVESTHTIVWSARCTAHKYVLEVGGTTLDADRSAQTVLHRMAVESAFLCAQGSDPAASAPGKTETRLPIPPGTIGTLAGAIAVSAGGSSYDSTVSNSVATGKAYHAMKGGASMAGETALAAFLSQSDDIGAAIQTACSVSAWAASEDWHDKPKQTQTANAAQAAVDAATQFRHLDYVDTPAIVGNASVQRDLTHNATFVRVRLTHPPVRSSWSHTQIKGGLTYQDQRFQGSDQVGPASTGKKTDLKLRGKIQRGVLYQNIRLETKLPNETWQIKLLSEAWAAGKTLNGYRSIEQSGTDSFLIPDPMVDEADGEVVMHAKAWFEGGSVDASYHGPKDRMYMTEEEQHMGCGSLRGRAGWCRDIPPWADCLERTCRVKWSKGSTPRFGSFKEIVHKAIAAGDRLRSDATDREVATTNDGEDSSDGDNRPNDEGSADGNSKGNIDNDNKRSSGEPVDGDNDNTSDDCGNNSGVHPSGGGVVHSTCMDIANRLLSEASLPCFEYDATYPPVKSDGHTTYAPTPYIRIVDMAFNLKLNVPGHASTNALHNFLVATGWKVTADLGGGQYDCECGYNAAEALRFFRRNGLSVSWGDLHNHLKSFDLQSYHAMLGIKAPKIRYLTETELLLLCSTFFPAEFRGNIDRTNGVQSQLEEATKLFVQGEKDGGTIDDKSHADSFEVCTPPEVKQEAKAWNDNQMGDIGITALDGLLKLIARYHRSEDPIPTTMLVVNSSPQDVAEVASSRLSHWIACVISEEPPVTTATIKFHTDLGVSASEVQGIAASIGELVEQADDMSTGISSPPRTHSVLAREKSQMFEVVVRGTDIERKIASLRFKGIKTISICRLHETCACMGSRCVVCRWEHRRATVAIAATMAAAAAAAAAAAVAAMVVVKNATLQKVQRTKVADERSKIAQHMAQDSEFADKCCINNRIELETDGAGYCLDCVKLVDTSTIKEWADEEGTAICPHCSMDVIIPVSCIPCRGKQQIRKLLGTWKSYRLTAPTPGVVFVMASLGGWQSLADAQQAGWVHAAGDSICKSFRKLTKLPSGVDDESVFIVDCQAGCQDAVFKVQLKARSIDDASIDVKFDIPAEIVTHEAFNDCLQPKAETHDDNEATTGETTPSGEQTTDIFSLSPARKKLETVFENAGRDDGGIDRVDGAQGTAVSNQPAEMTRQSWPGVEIDHEDINADGSMVRARTPEMRTQQPGSRYTTQKTMLQYCKDEKLTSDCHIPARCAQCRRKPMPASPGKSKGYRATTRAQGTGWAPVKSLAGIPLTASNGTDVSARWKGVMSKLQVSLGSRSRGKSNSNGSNSGNGSGKIPIYAEPCIPLGVAFVHIKNSLTGNLARDVKNAVRIAVDKEIKDARTVKAVKVTKKLLQAKDTTEAKKRVRSYYGKTGDEFFYNFINNRFSVLKVGVVEESFNVKRTGDLIHELQKKEKTDKLGTSEERTLRCAQEQILLLTSGKNDATAPMEGFVTRRVQYNTKAYKDKKSVSPINIGRWYCDSPIGIIEDPSGSEADFFVQMKRRCAALASQSPESEFWGSVDDCAWHFEGYPKEDAGNPQDASFKKSYLLGVVRPHQIAPRRLRASMCKDSICRFDIVNCHYTIVWNCTPDNRRKEFGQLMKYAVDREGFFDQLRENLALSDVTNADLKKLMIIILYGGSMDCWKELKKYPLPVGMVLVSRLAKFRDEVKRWTMFILADREKTPQWMLDAAYCKVYRRIKSSWRAAENWGPSDKEAVFLPSVLAFFLQHEENKLIQATIRTATKDLQLADRSFAKLACLVFDGFGLTGIDDGEKFAERLGNAMAGKIRSGMVAGSCMGKDWCSHPVLAFKISDPDWLQNAGTDGFGYRPHRHMQCLGCGVTSNPYQNNLCVECAGDEAVAEAEQYDAEWETKITQKVRAFTNSGIHGECCCGKCEMDDVNCNPEHAQAVKEVLRVIVTTRRNKRRNARSQRRPPAGNPQTAGQQQQTTHTSNQSPLRSRRAGGKGSPRGRGSPRRAGGGSPRRAGRGKGKGKGRGKGSWSLTKEKTSSLTRGSGHHSGDGNIYSEGWGDASDSTSDTATDSDNEESIVDSEDTEIQSSFAKGDRVVVALGASELPGILLRFSREIKKWEVKLDADGGNTNTFWYNEAHLAALRQGGKNPTRDARIPSLALTNTIRCGIVPGGIGYAPHMAAVLSAMAYCPTMNEWMVAADKATSRIDTIGLDGMFFRLLSETTEALGVLSFEKGDYITAEDREYVVVRIVDGVLLSYEVSVSPATLIPIDATKATLRAIRPDDGFWAVIQEKGMKTSTFDESSATLDLAKPWTLCACVVHGILAHLQNAGDTVAAPPGDPTNGCPITHNTMYKTVSCGSKHVCDGENIRPRHFLTCRIDANSSASLTTLLRSAMVSKMPTDPPRTCPSAACGKQLTQQETVHSLANVIVAWLDRPSDEPSSLINRSEVAFQPRICTEDLDGRGPNVTYQLQACIRYVDCKDADILHGNQYSRSGYICYTKDDQGRWWLHDLLDTVEVEWESHVKRQPMIGFLYDRGSQV